MLILKRILPLLILIFATLTASAQLASPRTYPLSAVGDRLVRTVSAGGGAGGDVRITLTHADRTDLSDYEVAITFGELVYRGPYASPITIERRRLGYYQRPLQIYLIDTRAGKVHSWRNDTLYGLGLENAVEITLNPARTEGREFLFASVERPESSSELGVNGLTPIGGNFGDPHEGTNAFTMGDPHEGTNTFNKRGADGGAVNPGTTEQEANQWYEQQQRTADSLEDIIADRPDDLQAQMALGAANDSLGIHYNAIRAWHEAVNLAPRDPVALVGLARANDNYVRDSVPGQRSLSQIITAEPALGYLERDEQTTALDPLMDALKIDPNNAEANALAGRIYRRMGERKQAAAYTKKAVDRAPNNARYLGELAVINAELGDNAKAIDAATKAVKIDGSDMRARRALAGLLSRTGKHLDAIKAAMPIVQRDSTDGEAWLVIGTAHAALGKHAAAIDPLRAATRHARNPGEAYETLGASLLALNRADEARVAYQLAAEFRPDLAERHYRSGTDAIGSGDRKRAARELEILRLMDSSRAADLQNRLDGR
jgi:Flp pilus assembly protein TadD